MNVPVRIFTVPIPWSALIAASIAATVVAAFVSTAVASPPARIAIIIDDLGYQADLDRAVLTLDSRIAVAILPDGPGATDLATQAARQGREALVHLPLSHVRSGDCEKALCPRREWSAERMRQHLDHAARQVPHAVGLNNHQGSLFTADPGSTRRLIEGLVLLNRHRDKPLFVVDSRTTPHTQLAREASRAGIATAQRQVFLDHERSAEAIAQAWKRLIERARDDGQAIAIGHPYRETVAFLARAIPALEGSGIELVPVSDLISATGPQTVPIGQAAPARAYRPSTE